MSRRRIAVFACAISMDNQRKMIQGIINEARANDTDTFIFTCQVNYNDGWEKKEGAFRIVDLPELEQFDGIIIVRNTIQDDKIADKLTERIRKSKVPAISIDEEVEGLAYVGIDDYNAIKDITKHVIERHGVRRINFISGIMSNVEGNERYRAFVETMERYNLPVDSSNIYFGNYSVESGFTAVDFFKMMGELPEAIVCANDNMALGAITRLTDLGYRCPEDIIVTGIDRDDFAHNMKPSLTTMNRKQDQLGIYAVRYVLGLESDSHKEYGTEFLLGESCGCHELPISDWEEERKNYFRERLIIESAIEAVKNMTSDMAVLDDINDFRKSISKHLMHTGGECVWVCLCEYEDIFRTSADGNEEADIVNTAYTEYVTAPCICRKGRVSDYGKFLSKYIIPPDEQPMKPTYYIISPVYYNRWCYGYTVSANDDFPIYTELYYAWINNIGIGIESIRKKKQLREVIDRLNGLWAYDALTQLYNRSGFYAEVDDFIQKARELHEIVYILFMDMDELKSVNDTLGHENGDLYIRTMGHIIRECTEPGALAMRYGGDEFVVIGSDLDIARGKVCMNRIMEEIDQVNKQGIYDFNISASIGLSIYEAEAVSSIKGLLEDADKKMYLEKRHKKHTREIG